VRKIFKVGTIIVLDICAEEYLKDVQEFSKLNSLTLYQRC